MGVEGGKVGGGRWEGYGNGQVRFDRFDRRSDSMPVFAVGWLGMIPIVHYEPCYPAGCCFWVSISQPD